MVGSAAHLRAAGREGGVSECGGILICIINPMLLPRVR